MTPVVAMKKDEGMRWVNAAELFGLKAEALDFDVPVFTDKSQHVPEIDDSYQFNPETLVPALWGIIHNKKMWLHGHTGTGKSTLVEQICARLNWGMVRINFDSEITRMDLIGRDVLKKDETGATVSEFMDGVLAWALPQPVVILCDEVDFIRADVAYVFQRALDDEGLMVSEDGGRIVKPHPWNRIVATANTQGQGDDFGLYQGARPQSMAFLDRFTVWVKCDYLPKAQEEKLLKARVRGIKGDRLKEIMQYTIEHRQAFTEGKIMQPLSPRSVITLAESVLFYEGFKGTQAFEKAAAQTLLNKANNNDGNVMKGIINRVKATVPPAVPLAGTNTASI